jgi:hypothetical protein
MNADKLLLTDDVCEGHRFTRWVKCVSFGTSSASAFICVHLRFHCRFRLSTPAILRMANTKAFYRVRR